MDERDVLCVQVRTLEGQLARTRTAVEDQQPDKFPQSRAGLPLRHKAEDLRKRVEACRLLADNRAEPTVACWRKFRELQAEAIPLFAECLAFVQGVFLRTAGVDEGLCGLADALLDEVASFTPQLAWLRYTVPAEREFFKDLAQIVRVRFPDVGVWSLPMAVHEFGHFFGPRMEAEGWKDEAGNPVPRPLESMLRSERKEHGMEGEAHLHERFADLFATYTAGPAYACTCILLRLDAARAAESEWSHPSPNERAYWVLKVLERVVADSAGPLGRYGDIVEQLREAWSGMCQAANSSLITAEETKTVDVWFARLFPLIESCAGLAKYQGWLAVQRLAGVLNPDRSPAPVPALQPEEGIRDVLNAAWLCRLDYFADRFAVEKIGEHATGLCTAAAKAGPH